MGWKFLFGHETANYSVYVEFTLVKIERLLGERLNMVEIDGVLKRKFQLLMI